MSVVDKKLYYSIKPFIPRHIQIILRRHHASIKRIGCTDAWPIDENAAKFPVNWKGWPGQKQFAFVLTHDVETDRGHAKCKELIEIDNRFGFRSCYNFVPKRYNVSAALRDYIVQNGGEVGVHGLYHDGKLYQSERIFQTRAKAINRYLGAWGAVGFRSPAMHHNLEWLHRLRIEYDSSTFDTDPFQIQSDGAGTIFPFWVEGNGDRKGYVELPYTLPQDFELFILLKEKNIDIWKDKLIWIAEKGGMALVNTHPDYINFNGVTNNFEEYPVRFYLEFLTFVKEKFQNRYWHALPRELAEFWRNNYS